MAKQAVMRPNRWFVGLGFGLWALTPLTLVLAAATGIWPLLTVLVHSLIFGTMAYTYGTRSLKRARAEEGSLTLDDESLRLDGRPVVRRDDIKQAFVVPSAGETFVRLDRKGPYPALFVRVKDEAEAKALVHSLGFSAGQVAAELKVASQLHAMTMPKQLALLLGPIFLIVPAIVLTAHAFASSGGPVVMGLVFLLLAWIFSLVFGPTTVRVGTDGIVTQWLQQKRFYPHTRIKAVSKYREQVTNKVYYGVKVTLDGGEVVKIPTGQTDLAEQEAARLMQRIEEARAQGGGSTATTTEALARGARQRTDWVRALRRLGEGAFGPRTAAVPRDQILRILEDGTALPLDRASAAVAALSTADAMDREDAKARVRVAAETAASPELRIALDRIVEASEDEEAIGVALEELGQR